MNVSITISIAFYLFESCPVVFIRNVNFLLNAILQVFKLLVGVSVYRDVRYLQYVRFLRPGSDRPNRSNELSKRNELCCEAMYHKTLFKITNDTMPIRAK